MSDNSKQHMPIPDGPELEQVDFDGQPSPGHKQSLEPGADSDRWERTKGLPDEEDDNFPATSDEALPDEDADSLILRDLLDEDEDRSEDE